MLKIVCFASVVAMVCGQHQLYPGDPGYQGPPSGYQPGSNQYQSGPSQYQGGPGQYQPGSNQYQPGPSQYQPGPSQYQGGPSQYQAPGQEAPITATNYRTDDGQQRSETRDNEGNVRGQYSYVDPNGKTILVKYTAGKDGFQVEGDHLPKAPVPQAPVGPQSQGQYNAYQQAQNRGAQQFPSQPQPQYNPQQYQQPQPQYNPQQYQQPQPQPQQYQPQPRPQQYQQPQQQQQFQPLSNFPQAPQSQHRFGASQQAAPQQAAPGINVNVDPSGSYNYQFNYQ